jgi:hypothetical protein
VSDYMLVANVGLTLAEILRDDLRIDPQIGPKFTQDNSVSLESPFDLVGNDSVGLSVYLYRIMEDPIVKNQFPVAGRGSRARKPPLMLNLYYLVTPLLADPTDRHRVIGKVMQVLYDRAALPVIDKAATTDAPPDEVRVILNPVTLEETTRVWQALEMSYRLSVCYLIRVAVVDSEEEEFLQPVVARQAGFGEIAGTRAE